MAKERPQIVRIGAYIGIAFISFLLIFFFVGTDIIGSFFGGGMGQSVVAEVNGKPVHIQDFLSYRDRRFGQVRDDNMMDYVLNSYLREELVYQKATKLGFTPSDKRVVTSVREIPWLQNSEGVFERDKYVYFKNRNLINGSIIKREIAIQDFQNFIQMGCAWSKDDIEREYIAGNTNIKLSILFLSEQAIREKYDFRVKVFESEIDEAMKTAEVKDPETDRARIKKQLEDSKIAGIKAELAKTGTTLSQQGARLNHIQGAIGGLVLTTEVFTPGSTPKLQGDAKTQIYDFFASSEYQQQLMSVNQGDVSGAIQTARGIYFFTALQKEQPDGAPSDAERDRVAAELLQKAFSEANRTFITELASEARIRKNLKTN